MGEQEYNTVRKMTDTLSLDYHTRRLIVKALNVCKTKNDAAHALGISVRQIYREIRVFDIRQDPKTRNYYYTGKIEKP